MTRVILVQMYASAVEHVSFLLLKLSHKSTEDEVCISVPFIPNPLQKER